jgi:hypothetical protein
MKDFDLEYLLQMSIKSSKWLINHVWSLLIFTKNQSPYSNSNLFVSNEHLKILLSVFIFWKLSCIIWNYGSWAGYQIDGNEKENLMRPYPTSNSQNQSNDEWFLDFLLQWWCGDRRPSRLHATKSELSCDLVPCIRTFFVYKKIQQALMQQVLV